jgi:hypothetical protein
LEYAEAPMSGLAGLVLALAMAATKPADPSLAASLQHSVSAVLDLGAPTARLVLVEQKDGVENRRVLKVGDGYRDGWKLASIGAREVVLERKGERRSVALFTDAPQVADAETPPAAPSSVSLSNAGAKGLKKPRSPEVARAVAAGDAQAVLKAGGSYQDAVAAITTLTANAQGRPRLPTFLALFQDTSDGSTIADGQVNGQPALIRTSPDGGFMNLTLDGTYAIVGGGGAAAATIGALPTDQQTYVPPQTFISTQSLPG